MTICELFESSVRKFPNRPYLLDKINGSYAPLTYTETRDEVRRFAAGLMAMGLQKGDRVALLAEGCANWVMAELGALYCGAVNVPLSVKLTEPADIAFRVKHAGVRFFMVSPGQNRKLELLKDTLPDLEKVILLGSATDNHPKNIAFGRFNRWGSNF